MDNLGTANLYIVLGKEKLAISKISIEIDAVNTANELPASCFTEM